MHYTSLHKVDRRSKTTPTGSEVAMRREGSEQVIVLHLITQGRSAQQHHALTQRWRIERKRISSRLLTLTREGSCTALVHALVLQESNRQQNIVPWGLACHVGAEKITEKRAVLLHLSTQGRSAQQQPSPLSTMALYTR